MRLKRFGIPLPAEAAQGYGNLQTPARLFVYPIFNFNAIFKSFPPVIKDKGPVSSAPTLNLIKVDLKVCTPSAHISGDLSG